MHRAIKRIKIWTDGACTGNHHKNYKLRKAGCGIYYAKNDTRNKSVKLKPCKNHHLTNNRAELLAIAVALNQNKNNKVQIITDSTYSRDVITKWAESWKKKGWKKSNKKQPENLDIIKPLYYFINSMKYKPTFKWVKGHSNSFENNEADRLANQALY